MTPRVPLSPGALDHRRRNPHLVKYEAGPWCGCADWKPELADAIKVSFRGKADWYRRTDRKTMVPEHEAEATIYVFERSEDERNHQ